MTRLLPEARIWSHCICKAGMLVSLAGGCNRWVLAFWAGCAGWLCGLAVWTSRVD